MICKRLVLQIDPFSLLRVISVKARIWKIRFKKCAKYKMFWVNQVIWAIRITKFFPNNSNLWPPTPYRELREPKMIECFQWIFAMWWHRLLIPIRIIKVNMSQKLVDWVIILLCLRITNSYLIKNIKFKITRCHHPLLRKLKDRVNNKLR